MTRYQKGELFFSVFCSSRFYVGNSVNVVVMQYDFNNPTMDYIFVMNCEIGNNLVELNKNSHIMEVSIVLVNLCNDMIRSTGIGRATHTRKEL